MRLYQAIEEQPSRPSALDRLSTPPPRATEMLMPDAPKPKASHDRSHTWVDSGAAATEDRVRLARRASKGIGARKPCE